MGKSRTEVVKQTEVATEDAEEVSEVREVVEEPLKPPGDPGTPRTHQSRVVNAIIDMVQNLGIV